MSSAREYLTSFYKKIIQKNVFLGYFLTMLQKTIVGDSDEQTKVKMKNHVAAVLFNNFTDLPIICINEKYIDVLSEKEFLAIIEHELMHIMYKHAIMSATFPDKELFNIAADIEINQYIDGLPGNDLSYEQYEKKISEHVQTKDSKIESWMLRGLYPEDFGFKKDEKNKGTIYYYRELDKKRKNTNDEGGQRCEALLQEMRKDVFHRGNHYSWKSVVKFTEEELHILNSTINSAIKTLLSNLDTREKCLGNIMSAELRELLEELFINRPPTTDWKLTFRNLLANSIEYTIKTSKLKLNKRNEDNPGMRLVPKLNIMCFIDTSGSMSDKDIQMCFTEIDHFRKLGHVIYIGETDCSFDPEKDMFKFTGTYPSRRGGMSGGGSTRSTPALSYILNNKKINYDIVIYLTDGMMSGPVVKIKQPLIWVIVPSGEDVQTLKNNGFYGNILKMKN